MKKSKIIKKIIAGIFISVISGLILFYLTSETKFFQPDLTQQPNHPFYTLLEKEQLKLESLEKQLSQKETALITEKQQQSLIDKLFGGNKTVKKIKQDIAFLQKEIDNSKNKMSYLIGELQKLEKNNDHDNPVFATLLNFILIFLVIGVVILFMYVNGG